MIFTILILFVIATLAAPLALLAMDSRTERLRQA